MDDFGSFGGGGSGGGSGQGQAAASSASSTSGINFGSGALFSSDGGLTPLAGVILGAVALLAFVALIIVGKK